MMNRLNLISQITVLGLAVLALTSCNEDDAKWEAGREAIGGQEAVRIHNDEDWGLYQNVLIRSLDQMDAALRVAAGGAPVFDRKEIDGLMTRIAALRKQLVALVDEPRESRVDKRIRLRDAFKETRKDVDAVLTRLQHNPDDIARWQDAD